MKEIHRSSDESLVIARNIQDRIDGRSRSRQKRIDGDLYAEYLQHRFSRGTTINSTAIIGSRNQFFLKRIRGTLKNL